MERNENLNTGDVIHVESYTRSDGTDVKAHSRHKPGRGHFTNNGFMEENPYKNPLGGIIEPNHAIMDEKIFNTKMSYQPMDNFAQNTNNNFVLEGGGVLGY